jgi:hypothetical protein
MNEPTCFVFYGFESTKRGEAVSASASAKRKRKKASVTEEASVGE